MGLVWRAVEAPTRPMLSRRIAVCVRTRGRHGKGQRVHYTTAVCSGPEPRPQQTGASGTWPEEKSEEHAVGFAEMACVTPESRTEDIWFEKSCGKTRVCRRRKRAGARYEAGVFCWQGVGAPAARSGGRPKGRGRRRACTMGALYHSGVFWAGTSTPTGPSATGSREGVSPPRSVGKHQPRRRYTSGVRLPREPGESMGMDLLNRRAWA